MSIAAGSAYDYSRFSAMWWLISLSVASVSSLFIWTSVLYVIPPLRLELLDEFIDRYGKLMKLLNHEWGYQFEHPTCGPGVRAEFKEVDPFVRKRLEKLAAQIKALENPKADWGDCLGGSPDPKELRKEFGCAFDILKPFGLVYPTYDPYFNPEGAYFYG
jgi:hypothetical protein